MSASTKQGFGRLAWRGLLLVSPLLAGLLTYVICDPFRVLRTYDFGNYYDEAAPVELNRDYVSMKLFEKYDPQKKFNAFIFGSSRTFPMHCDEWSKHLPEDARPFHYPAASETLYGMEKKLAWLEATGVPVRHALLEMSVAMGDAAPGYDAFHRLHYALTKESWLDYQAGVLKSFFTDFYFVKYMSFVALGKVTDFSRPVLGVRPGTVTIDPQTNDYFFSEQDRELAADEDAYYRNHSAYFAAGRGPTSPSCNEPVVHAPQREVLTKIRDHLVRLGTDYRILLAPDRTRFCRGRADVDALRSIFGADRVFDFTGENAFSRDEKNFYDIGHLRPQAAARLLDRVYDGRGSEAEPEMDVRKLRP